MPLHIVLFNRKYRRQFEAVVSQRVWDKNRKAYGFVGAATLLIAECHRIHRKKGSTTKRESTARMFIIGSLVRPDIYGTSYIKVGRSKKEILERRFGELAISTKRGIYAGRHRG